ncbi:MAG: hypothetical protein K2W81_13165 [Sphingomonas sp.]|uniref:YiiX/YebB-like N1pC/P60 family cysteine hydrolase n=1 Tax=Sphingomonas sp. TaxID=28214 RepID=UPI0025F3A1CE|nr:YiiX/YebB-like N1pC/P60 family cysteine hydrolase [Sphingomonas sp.]MBY0284895.1 hypothetical protein [Sphingomonas sp.]
MKTKMKRIRVDALRPGDIVLTARRTASGKGVRLSTAGTVSHAMICVQQGSIIDSTSDGVQARNVQREFFWPADQVHAFRLKEPLDEATLLRLVEYTRSQIGTRYSLREAARSVTGGARPRGKRQFCSRLVALAYAYIGIHLVADEDYCTPEELRRSPLLDQLEDPTETVSAEEVAFWRDRPDPIKRTHDSQTRILRVARKFDATIENFEGLPRLVRERPDADAAIAEVLMSSGYLRIWDMELKANPWRFDLEIMESLATPDRVGEVRDYCGTTIAEAYSGGHRFAVVLGAHRAEFQIWPRTSTALLIALYERLVRDDQRRRETALRWLQRHFPDDAVKRLERVEPHSALWFHYVDRVEPALGEAARRAIASEGALQVCSSCGDLPRDYRLINAADAMPGVPSLRLCDDCVAIRRAMGEALVLLP